MLLDNLVDLPWQLRYRILTWQTLLVVIGLIQMIKGKPGAGVILIILGIIFWIDEYGYYDWSELWPLILIGIGIVLFLRSRGHKNVHYRGTDGEYIDNLAIFGGTNKVITDRSFKGGKLTSIFGGIDLDLSDAGLAGGKAHIDTFTIFGAFKTIVPKDWKVNAHITCLFGGFNDKRKNKPTTDSKNELTITGIVIFGGGDLLN